MDLSALLRIHLNSNQLTRIPNGLFEPLHHLKILDLSSNSIVDIYPWVFPFSSETINLANNRLQSIPRPLSSESLMELHTLDIRNNEISDATNVTYFIHETDNLLLDGNPFRCDCSFNDVREWIQRDETLRTSCTWTCVNTVTMEIVLARTLKPEDTACPADTTTTATASTPGDVTEESNTSKEDTSTEKTDNSSYSYPYVLRVIIAIAMGIVVIILEELLLIFICFRVWSFKYFRAGLKIVIIVICFITYLVASGGFGRVIRYVVFVLIP
ncbi:variable lymphocyte receptor A [Apostichopus japonicus]|uniref:Variable lymphocyte receptor A n=1 Tax=Stichopus japonicus TaxID=307972 RepID=A0A2G8LAH8_STIJA|nr:variable lymphocyte receptor A [Apostichopus japonicus]